jgi:hypothetical protein
MKPQHLRIHLPKGVPVMTAYSTPSRFVRLVAVLAASVLTGTLFTAVAIGLTGDGWSVFAQYDEQAAQPAVRLA